MLTDLKLIADSINPPTELTLENKAIEVMNLIPGRFTGPSINRILRTERMTQLEILRQRDGVPQLLRWRSD